MISSNRFRVKALALTRCGALSRLLVFDTEEEARLWVEQHALDKAYWNCKCEPPVSTDELDEFQLIVEGEVKQSWLPVW